MFKTLALAATVALAPLAALAEDQPVYLIASMQVNDFDAYMGDYGATAIPLILEAGGEILVGAPEVNVLEGDYPQNWTVVVKFPSEAAAMSWYDNPAYKDVIPARVAVSDGDLSSMLIAPQFQQPG